jgi:hypothetical protein
MNSVDASAIADFLKEGGRIVKVPESILVTAQDVRDYLKSCGVTGTCSADNLMVYLFDGKRIGLSKIVALANRQRTTQQLPLFTVRA